jgi:hypothetical protein
MLKVIPTAPSLPFYCTNRLLADGRNGLLSLQKVGPLTVRADKSDGVARVINHRYLNALRLSTKGHLCLRSQELQGK